MNVQDRPYNDFNIDGHEPEVQRRMHNSHLHSASLCIFEICNGGNLRPDPPCRSLSQRSIVASQFSVLDNGIFELPFFDAAAQAALHKQLSRGTASINTIDPPGDPITQTAHVLCCHQIRAAL